MNACTSDRVGLAASPAGALARHSTHPQMRSPSMRALLVGLCLAAAAPATGRLLLAEGPACNKTAAAWEYKDRCEALTSYQDGWGNASAGKLPPACTSGGLCCCDRLHAPSARVQCCAQGHRHPAPRLRRRVRRRHRCHSLPCPSLKLTGRDSPPAGGPGGAVPVPMPSGAMPALAEAAPGGTGGAGADGGTIGLATGPQVLPTLPCMGILCMAAVNAHACNIGGAV